MKKFEDEGATWTKDTAAVGKKSPAKRSRPVAGEKKAGATESGVDDDGDLAEENADDQPPMKKAATAPAKKTPGPSNAAKVNKIRADKRKAETAAAKANGDDVEDEGDPEEEGDITTAAEIASKVEPKNKAKANTKAKAAPAKKVAAINKDESVKSEEDEDAEGLDDAVEESHAEAMDEDDE